MQINELTVENFKRVKNITIKPDPTGAVIISGRNAQGKSSVMDAIWAAIGGKAGAVEKAVRDGEDQARVTVDLGDMVVVRTWRNGTTAVKVQSRDGAEYKSPQSLLDSFVGKLSFDPLAFTKLKKTEQREALISMSELPIDIDELSQRRANAYEARTEASRARRALGDAPTIDEDLPIEEYDIATLANELNVAEKHNNQMHRSQELVAEWTAQLAEYDTAVKRLQESIAQERERANVKPIDGSEIRERLGSVQETNAAIRANNNARELVNRIAEADAKHAGLEKQIAAIDAEKDAALAKAVYPVDGLGFDEDGVTFNGVPFSQASAAEQIRVSMGMAIAGNPKLRIVRVLDGSLLDEDGMKIITDLALNNDFQVWVERVANGDGVGFVIEDGELVDESANE